MGMLDTDDPLMPTCRVVLPVVMRQRCVECNIHVSCCITDGIFPVMSLVFRVVLRIVFIQ